VNLAQTRAKPWDIALYFWPKMTYFASPIIFGNFLPRCENGPKSSKVWGGAPELRVVGSSTTLSGSNAQ
ncbi:MAG: hypothetical protein AAF975_04565, partial [Spirochaetota bacterium]